MLKFIKHNMSTIDGIETFPLVSFVMFFTFFILLTVYVLIQKKEYFKKMAEMPLDEHSSVEPINPETSC